MPLRTIAVRPIPRDNGRMSTRMTSEELSRRLKKADEELCVLYRAAEELEALSHDIRKQLRERHARRQLTV